MTTTRGHVPWHRSLRFRLAALLAACFLAVSFLGDRVLGQLEERLYPEWYDPVFLRGRAEALELAAAGELARARVNDLYPETYEAVMVPYRLVVTSVLAVVLAVAVTLLATRRLNRLARQVRPARPEEDGLPGPFAVAGGDEIAVLAGALNGMRQRATELIESLASRDRWRREWIAQVAHDLRTPLAALLACLERAQGAAVPTPETLAAARVDALRIHELTEDLLESARLEGETPLRREPVPAGELLRRTARVLEGLAAQRGVELQLDLPRGLPVLQAEGARLARALENLLRNALQHAAARVVVAAEVRGRELVLGVRDDGPGLPIPAGAAPLADVIERQRAGGSSGVGLVVAQRVAERHGGRAEAENCGAGGCAFRLILPLEEG